jgi:tetratricopeptide (TPR) repeat protein
MNANTKSMLRVGLILALPIALMLAGVVGAAVRGDYKTIPIVVCALLFAALFFWYSRARLRRMFKDPTPDRIIAYYYATARRARHGEASAAYLSSIAAAAYGQFDRARGQLEQVNWDELPEIYKGYRLHALAIIALLERRDFEGALELLREARAIAAPGGDAPAASQAAFSIYEAIIEAASGAGDDAVPKLEELANRKRGLISSFAAWALALHFRRTGQPDRAVAYQQVVREITPNCRPLNEFSTAAPAHERDL